MNKSFTGLQHRVSEACKTAACVGVVLSPIGDLARSSLVVVCWLLLLSHLSNGSNTSFAPLISFIQTEGIFRALGMVGTTFTKDVSWT